MQWQWKLFAFLALNNEVFLKLTLIFWLCGPSLQNYLPCHIFFENLHVSRHSSLVLITGSLKKVSWIIDQGVPGGGGGGGGGIKHWLVLWLTRLFYFKKSFFSPRNGEAHNNKRFTDMMHFLVFCKLSDGRTTAWTCTKLLWINTTKLLSMLL